MSDWVWLKYSPEYDEIFDNKPARLRYVKCAAKGMTGKEIAAECGVAQQVVSQSLKLARQHLRRHGIDLATDDQTYTPDPHYLKGRSTLYKYGEDGQKVKALEWVKTDKDKDRQEQVFAEAIQAMAQGIEPFKTVPPPEAIVSNRCTVYTLTDFHLGQYAWADETGAGWDMKIAENVMLNSFAEMLDGSPAAEAGIFAQLGDLLHWDGLLALTPTAKNVLDADTRFPLLVETAIRVCLKAVEMMLHKHQTVHVLMAEGNHDLASSVWLRAIMSHTFRDNPRVTVEGSPFPYYAYIWGKVFIAWHHGHLQKMEELPLRFATDPKFREGFGKCEYTYIHTGHMHHKLVIERAGIHVEQHPTLAARDAHGARGFQYSQRGATAITYDKALGEVSRKTVRPDFSEVKVA